MFLFNRTPSVSTQELQGLLDKKVKVIDVREPGEFQMGHIPGAKNVPLGKIDRYDQAEGPVYVICHSGMRSKQGASVLIEKGLEAYNVKGGMMSWTGATRKGKI